MPQNEGELLPERLTRTVDADSRIARGDSGLCREGFKAEFGQIYIKRNVRSFCKNSIQVVEIILTFTLRQRTQLLKQISAGRAIAHSLSGVAASQAKLGQSLSVSV
jgi:hypothetical protein